MKKLKEPKTFKRPRAYIRVNGKEKIDRPLEFRLRIIYPDGKAEWADGFNSYSDTDGFVNSIPCWHPNYKMSIQSFFAPGNRTKSKITAKKAVKLMKAYDKEEGFKTLFIGEF